VQSIEQNWISTACRWLGASGTTEMPMGIARELSQVDGPQLESLLNVVSANFDELKSGTHRWRQLMQHVAVRLIALSSAEKSEVAIVSPDILVRLAEMLTEIDDKASAHCLQILAAQKDEESINALAALLAENPPQDFQCVGIALSPLWKLDGELLALFFDRLDGGYVHPATMSALLDLANYATRTKKLATHPFADRAGELIDLLDKLTIRLQAMELDPRKFGNDVESILRVLNESIALSVSLCDAFGLIGEKQAIEVLQKALALSHRRVQTEAAGALASLRDATGKQRLIELAADRVARLRAVAYAEELGIADEIDVQLRMPAALAEAELASWLAAGDRFGIAPHSMELVDSRSQYWPSYEEPRDCYLFRYTYFVSSGQLSNIGIAGPLTYAFNSDLADLPPDDIYAAFAGWQAEHEDIFEVPEQLLNIEQRREADRLIRGLEDHDIVVKQVLALTFFFGEIALLAMVAHEDRKLFLVTDGTEQLSFPASSNPAALTPDLVLSIFRGRKLLRSFNH
jgi:hypothetical protein